MKIVDKSSNKVSLESISYGSVFKIPGYYGWYIKLDDATNLVNVDDYCYIIAQLNDGSLGTLPRDECIIPIDCELVIK